ncbi:MAG TPA: D-alanyl-D-alanine carboxypeptidase/D-alanyl-D-alanine-endopeptidase [Gaiellaceae bacterium]|nr:D-alanyl-D-alanine carboxypeptidase/D-alanyl-D-alanine-endopeptidase [Gaiellaceae bacterium]
MTRSRAALAAASVAVAALVASTSSPAAAPAVDLALARAVQAPGVAASQTAAIAIDLRSGETLFSQNAGRGLLPASAEKLSVSFTALHILGPRFRFRTELVGKGSRSGGTWKGDLFLVGYGDPTLDDSDLDRLARRFADTGITRVAGRVFGDDTYFDARRDAPGWKPRYLGIESRPLSALSVAGVHLIGANGSAVAAARGLAAALEKRGIDVRGSSGARRAPASSVPIAFDLSERLSNVVHHMNAESDNFVAEMVLKQLGATVAEPASTAAGASVVRETLAHAAIPLGGVRIADGSGLSRYDRSTVMALAGIVRAGATDPTIGRAFVASLAVAGVSGTLRNRLATRPTRGRIHAKTGTTNRASALAGLVGNRYVFAILHNGRPVPYWTARAAQDRFVQVLARS